MKNPALPAEQLFEMVFGDILPDRPGTLLPRQLPSDLFQPGVDGEVPSGLDSLLHSETHFHPVTLLFPGPNSYCWFRLATVADIDNRPPSSRRTRVHRAARSILWVTTTEVR